MRVINGAEVRGENGLKVKFGKDHVSYIKNDYAVTIAAEFTVNPVLFMIYFSTLKTWHPPHESELISDEQKNDISNSITQALAMLNVKFEAIYD